MALVTVQRSPSPSGSADTEEHDTVDADDSNLKSPRQRRRRSKSALKKLKKLFNTVRFVSKLKPCFSESYFTVKGAALILPQSDYEGAYARKPSKSQGELQTHLQAMFSLLRPQDIITVAVKLEGTHTRYLAVVSCIGRQDTEESVILGVNLRDKPEIGLIVPIWAHTKIELDGDGGFSMKSDNNIHIFKPVSVQAMWSALQSLNKVVKIATDKLYIPRGLTHTWVGFYEARLSKDTAIVTEWNYKADIDATYRLKSSKVDQDFGEKKLKRSVSDSAASYSSLETTSEEEFYRQLKTELKLVMMTVDLEEVTCRYLREALEKKLEMDLGKYKGIIDLQMFEIMGQMDAPSLILDHLYLGSEWNASNLEELQENGVHHILNISREIDNFFTGILHYMNVREWDVEQSNLLKYWEDTYKFINKARKRGSKTLVHCKMGISRSASTVIAYLMKEKKWSLKEAYDFTKAKRSIVNPNAGFWKQLETYEGILKASWNRDSFERKSDHIDKPPDIEEVPEESEFHSAEDMLAINLGKHLPDSSDLPFLDTEKDIEIASRSADSTEESLPDQLSPDLTTDPLGSKKKRFNRFDSNVAESGDYISSDSSEYTDSDHLSSDGEEHEDKVFQAIDIPEITVDKKMIVKPKSRRVKSESDKALLTIDEGSGQGISRESSVSKFKPDGSWIKAESEDQEGQDKEETASYENIEYSQDNERSDKAELEMKVSESGVTADTQTMLGNVTKDREPVTFEIGDDNKVQSDEKEISENITSQGETKGLEPYVKENIPWNFGTVRKQKQDLEEKYGSAAHKKADLLSEKDKRDKIENTHDAETMITTDENTETVDHDANTRDETEQTEQIKTEDEADNKPSPVESPKSRRSVYELEEISLPEGLVRKAMQEIEERNRSSESESPRKRLHRSSSLKSNRVTPKAKNRDNERRKTCIAILSPTSSYRSDSNQSATGDDSAFTDTDYAQSVDFGQLEASGPQASLDTDEDLQTGTVKIYKYMGEELTVQEGLVRKQTLDIEHKAKETTTKASLKPDKQQIELKLEEYSSDYEISDHHIGAKQVSTSSVESSQAANDATSVKDITFKPTESQENTEDKSVDVSSLSTIESIKYSLYDKGKKNEEISSDDQASKDSDASTTVHQRSKHGLRPDSCFDPETLHLIREIGSALMNSPAKLELEETCDDLKRGESLVNHFVRKIENNIQLSKKSVKREIIIVSKDKGKALEQKSNIPIHHSNDQDQKSVCDCNEIKNQSSTGSPVARRYTCPSSPKSDKGSKIYAQFSSTASSLSSSPVEKTKTEFVSDKLEAADYDKQLQDMNKTAADIVPTTENDNSPNSQNDTQDKSETSNKSNESSDTEGCSVKSLVGKFSAKAGSSPPNSSMIDMLGNTSNTTSPSSTCFSESVSGPVLGSARSPSQQDRPLLKHRQSEPVISLSEKSLQLFNKTVGGSGLVEREIVLDEADGESIELRRNKIERPDRPKSGGHIHDTLGASGHSRRTFLRQSHTMSESDSSHKFTWEGKKMKNKTKKTYGKSHPLAKLESRSSMDSIRNSPFYNTM